MALSSSGLRSRRRSCLRAGLALCAFLALLSGAPAPARAETDAQAFIRQSYLGLQDQQAANDALWHMQDASEWHLDMSKGEILFLFPDGHRVHAPVQIVGTYLPEKGQFLWGWDHPSVPASMSRDAKLVKAWADAHRGAGDDLARWTTRLVHCTEAEAWDFTAVAARLGHATGSYRGPTPGPIVFLTFGAITIEAAR